MKPEVKEETTDAGDVGTETRWPDNVGEDLSLIDLTTSSDSDDDDEDDGPFLDANGSGPDESGRRKRQKTGALDVVLPAGFLDPLPPPTVSSTKALSVEQSKAVVPATTPLSTVAAPRLVPSKQFWKAGDYEADEGVKSEGPSVGMDHVRVHPKFLHSNATSHKWALGAFAELLDNSVDEICNGATYVKIDVLINQKDKSKMLLVEDDGGGMDPDKIRQCMSLGYSAKSKSANTIGQYGNGFKTSTMRLGADVIVFSRYPGRDGKSPTQSIGLLSYTFLRSTGKEDIVVPMADYEKTHQKWEPVTRSSLSDWTRTLETIIQWSPYTSESDLLQQFSSLKEHGTRIIIYNLWEDDQGELELDFDTDRYDIQLRGVNRDEKRIQMSKQYPNSRHFLTYQHSLRSYTSIIYLRLPARFRLTLRGKDVAHHSLVKDMMLKQEITYKPQSEGIPKDANMVAVVTIGFVKDAKDHIDIQGFNVYHKNRLIKPFWRVWNAAGSNGRGVIGVLEANFVEPAHDKQGFERTTVLSRLEARLVQMQKTYWSANCHKVGYAPKHKKKSTKVSSSDNSSPEPPSSKQRKKALASFVGRSHGQSQLLGSRKSNSKSNVDQTKIRHLSYLPSSEALDIEIPSRPTPNELGSGNSQSSPPASRNKGSLCKKSASAFMDKKSKRLPGAHEDRDHPQSVDDDDCCETSSSPIERRKVNHMHASSRSKDSSHDAQMDKGGENGRNDGSTEEGAWKAAKQQSAPLLQIHSANHENGKSLSSSRREGENHVAEDRLKKLEEKLMLVCEELQSEKDKNQSLGAQLEEYKRKLEAASKEQESLIDIFAEERNRRDREEETLRKKLKDAYTTVQELLQKQQLCVKPER
ncbi:protein MICRORCHIDIA 7-like [Nymphaea colorata]|nr:protein MICRORCHIDIA 7-like [Nymphaea colorata]